MLQFMAELTRNLCGEEKAQQIQKCTDTLIQSQNPEWGQLVEENEAYESIANLLQRCAYRTLEEILSNFSGYYKKDLIGGLIKYTSKGITITYKNRSDWALHFIYGAWIELAFGLGKEAGYLKEFLDKEMGTGQYDEGDIQATTDGAKWSKLKTVVS
jgi:hypothetical protein